MSRPLECTAALEALDASDRDADYSAALAASLSGMHARALVAHRRMPCNKPGAEQRNHVLGRRTVNVEPVGVEIRRWRIYDDAGTYLGTRATVLVVDGELVHGTITATVPEAA